MGVTDTHRWTVKNPGSPDPFVACDALPFYRSNHGSR